MRVIALYPLQMETADERPKKRMIVAPSILFFPIVVLITMSFVIQTEVIYSINMYSIS